VLVYNENTIGGVMSQSENAKNSRHRRIKMMKDKLGAKCFLCGYDKNYSALDFHHIKEKSFALNTIGMERKLDVIEAEVAKCILLCANCHRDIHTPGMSRDEASTLSNISRLPEEGQKLVMSGWYKGPERAKAELERLRSAQAKMMILP
jgi:predicted HNH restriction endonuclease